MKKGKADCMTYLAQSYMHKIKQVSFITISLIKPKCKKSRANK